MANLVLAPISILKKADLLRYWCRSSRGVWKGSNQAHFISCSTEWSILHVYSQLKVMQNDLILTLSVLGPTLAVQFRRRSLNV